MTSIYHSSSEQNAPVKCNRLMDITLIWLGQNRIKGNNRKLVLIYADDLQASDNDIPLNTVVSVQRYVFSVETTVLLLVQISSTERTACTICATTPLTFKVCVCGGGGVGSLPLQP